MVETTALISTPGEGTSPATSPAGTTRRAHVRLGLLSLVSVAGAACAGPGQAAQPAPAADAKRAPVTVRVHARTGSEDEAFQKRLTEFTQQNTKNITAVYEGLGDYFNTLVTRIVAGTAGDTAYLLHTNLVYQQYANGGVLRAVD